MAPAKRSGCSCQCQPQVGNSRPMTYIAPMPTITFKEATPESWSDFEKLFGDNGACGGCWCQHWRIPKGGKLWDEVKGKVAKSMMEELFKSGDITGLLAYDGKKAVAWCSYGPRENYSRINNMKAYGRNDTYGIWCINCFFIDKNYRRQGLARQMLDAAVKFITKREVKTIEAYPTPLTKAGKKLPAAFSFSGPLKMFEDAGFGIIQRDSHSRPLVRKTVD